MLDIKTCVLVMIDIQGKLLNVMYEKEALLENAQKLVKGLQTLSVPILLTEQNPPGLGPTQPEISQLLAGTPALPKLCFSCWQDKAFAAALTHLNRPHVLICGIEAHICVFQPALNLISQGYQVQVVADVVSSRTVKNKEAALSRLQSEGAKLTTVEMLLFELLSSAENPLFREISRIIK